MQSLICAKIPKSSESQPEGRSMRDILYSEKCVPAALRAARHAERLQGHQLHLSSFSGDHWPKAIL
jgi:hypothetical protein